MELKRKIFHIFSVVFLLAYLLVKEFFGEKPALIILTFILVLFIKLEFFRIKRKKKIPFVADLWREKERNSIGGEIFLLIGMIIALAVFEFKIAVAAILMAIFGDSVAAIVGMRFGKHWLKSVPNTAWEGILAELIVNLIIGFIFLPHWIIALAMALTATFVETVFTHADDNLLVPVFSGFVGEIVLAVLGTYKL